MDTRPISPGAAPCAAPSEAVGLLSDEPERWRETLRKTAEEAAKQALSPLFQTFSLERLSREYEPCDWKIGPFERMDELTFHKHSQWRDPWDIGWQGNAIHNASLLEQSDKLYLFYRCNPAMESLSARIGLAVHEDGLGWSDFGGNPIIYPTLTNETVGCEDPKIYRAEGKFFLFYEALSRPTARDLARYFDANYPVNELVIDINLAESNDLYHWWKLGPILSRSLSHLWAKGAVIAKDGAGNAVRIGGKYMMFVSEGCGGKQLIGLSDNMVEWAFHHEQYLDCSRFGRLYEVVGCVVDAGKGEHLIMDFFYDDGSGVSRSAEALYSKSAPTRQIALNRGGTLNVGGLIRYRGRWMHAQGWDAPPGKPVLYFYRA